MGKYVKENGYETEHLIDALDDESLLSHMGVPLEYIANAITVYRDDAFPDEIQAWLGSLAYIFRPSYENLEKGLCGRGLALYGPPGTGKTTMAAATLLTVIRKKIPNTDPTGRNRTWHGACMGAFVDWQDASDLFRSANRDEDDEEAADVLRRKMTPGGPVTKRADFLVVDDISRERPTEFNTGELQRTLRSRKSSGFPTIITTNHNPDDWEEAHGEVLGGYLHRAFSPIEFVR